MANYYTQFAVLIDMPREAAAHAAALADLIDRYCLHLTLYEVSEDAPDFDGWLDDDQLNEAARTIAHESESETDAAWDPGEKGLYVAGEESPNITTVADIIQNTMQRFALTRPVVIEWANFCSSMRPDSFGGGCVVITRNRQRWMSTRQWAEQQFEELELDAGFQSA